MQYHDLVKLIDVLKQAEQVFPRDNAQIKTKQDLVLLLAVMRLREKVEKRARLVKKKEKM